MDTATYDSKFFDNNQPGSLQSARVVVPLVLSLVKPQSVVDIGCGMGAWLKVFQENGVPIIRGFDGAYVDRSKLLIDPAVFSPIDLSKPAQIEGSYDLAACLEVAEHIPTRMNRELVRLLTSL